MPELRDYEIVFWLKDDAENNLEESITQKMQTRIEKSPSGKLIFTSRPTKKKLAWPIQKAPEGYFGFFVARLLPETVVDFKKNFERDPNILQLEIFQTVNKKFGLPVHRQKTPLKPKTAPTKVTEITMENLDKKLEEILKT